MAAIGNGLSITSCIELEAWMRTTQRNLEAGAAGGEVPAHALASWDRWCRETREYLCLPVPVIEPTAGQA